MMKLLLSSIAIGCVAALDVPTSSRMSISGSDVSASPNCASSIGAPFDLSSTPIITINSTANNGTYWIHPCGNLDSVCKDPDQQQCYSGSTFNITSGVTIGLGSASNTSWSINTPDDWTQGVTGINYKLVIDDDAGLCRSTATLNMFVTVYWCGQGDDSVAIVGEPQNSKDTCSFYFKVDSSVICKYIKSLNSSSSSSGSAMSSTGVTSSGPSLASSSSGPANIGCSPSYKAPFDLSRSPTLNAPSPGWTTGNATYYIQPCGIVDSTICPYSTNQQQCYSVVIGQLVSDGLGTANNTVWQAVHFGDWTQGIVGVSRDIVYDYDQCSTTPGVDSFTTTYICNKGDDSMTVVKEPLDIEGPCVFEMRVDSSVICAWVATQSSTGGLYISSTGSSDPKEEEGVAVTWVALISVIMLVAGLAAGACIAKFVMRRKNANRSQNGSVSLDDTYGDRLL